MRNSSQPKIQQYQKHGIEVPASESLGTRYPRDIAVWDKLESLINTNKHSHKHVLELFPAYVRRIHLGRFLAHYELFKLITDIPGCIVEAGVYRGSSLLTFSKLMEIFSPGDRTRRVFGFDNFKGLGNFHEKDGKEDPASGKIKGGWSAKNVQAEVEELINICKHMFLLKIKDYIISSHLLPWYPCSSGPKGRSGPHGRARNRCKHWPFMTISRASLVALSRSSLRFVRKWRNW